MVVVASKTRIWGPFSDANTALLFIRGNHGAIIFQDLPLRIVEVENTNCFGEGWIGVGDKRDDDDLPF